MLLRLHNFVSLITISLAAAVSVDDGSLRADGLIQPLGMSNVNPRLSWIPLSDTRGDRQTGYQVQVSSSPSFQVADLWDSGKVHSTAVWTTYAGRSLASRDVASWRVRIWDASDKPSSWSAIGSFEMGLLKESDWQAHWIANPEYIPGGGTSLPMFAKAFESSCSAKKARLYILGLGQFAAYVNGNPASDSVLDPSYSQTNASLPYSTYDVTPLMQDGVNLIGVEVGKGVYDAEQPVAKRYTDFITASNPPTVIARLEMTCQDDGSVHSIVSDESWKTSVSGPHLEASWYGGCEYDARNETKGWPNTSVDLLAPAWINATTITLPVGGTLTADPGPAMKVIDRWPARSVTAVNGSYIFDLGINIAGWFNITMHGGSAQRVVFWPGERLLSSGLVDQSTTGSPIFDGYTFAGRPSESYHPKFMYHGFRFIQVDNLTYTPEASDLEALVIRAENEAVGSFDTSSELFNSIHTIIDRSMQGNMHSVMTDCPHREKSGWLDDVHLVFFPLAQNYDVYAHTNRLVSIIADSQLPDGMIPTTAPEFKVFLPPYQVYRDEANWGNAIMTTSLYHYQTYGSTDLFEKYYDHMVHYVEYLTSETNGTSIIQGGLGDWESFDTTTPVNLTSTFGYQQAVAALTQIAAVLGKQSDVHKYAALNKKIQSAFHKGFFNTTTKNSYASGSMASNAIALDMGAVPSQYQSAVFDSLVKKIKDETYHMLVGEIALPSLFRVLQAHSRDDVLFDMMSVTTNVSYGFQVAQGATSLWEHWDGVSGSLNHWMFGYGEAWLRRLSGMSQATGDVAWQSIEFQPIVVGDLLHANSTFRSPRGWVKTAWNLDGDTLAYAITVPVGSTGTVTLSSTDVTESGRSLRQGNGITDIRRSGHAVTIQLGSGSYNFRAEHYLRG
ncbi:alpha-L-rhamnosidase [Rhizodiscina lignyota]|uniref:alpha-L-rhamnosidase n=1 Tax=Rhizodiscina lignyota TaxID=1504668 RepID=A0A9P4I6G0_9PEZI|nr:alpha-L-rhamnosidase [Rhizodiscina lignyota]